jgi:hypothetical protein
MSRTVAAARLGNRCPAPGRTSCTVRDVEPGADFDWDEPFAAGDGSGTPGERLVPDDPRLDEPRLDEPVREAPVVVPWAGTEEGWTIQEVEACLVRPGWWFYASEAVRFVEVTHVTLTTVGRGRTVFADLADGRTLALGDRAMVLVRRPR